MTMTATMGSTPAACVTGASVPLVWGRTPPLKCELLWWVGGCAAGR